MTHVHTLLSSTAFDWMECVRTSGLTVPHGNRWTVNVSLLRGQGTTYRGELDLVAHGLPAGVRFISERVPAGRTVWPVQFVADASSTPCATAIAPSPKRGLSIPRRGSKSRSQQNIPFINHPGGDAWRTVQLDRYVLAVTDLAVFNRDQAAVSGTCARRRVNDPREDRETRKGGFNEPVEFQCDWVSPGVAVQP